jgi:UDP-N-acetylglucosamine diphosphorylase / glucose-1-phosphate thymidylyltransferase / UDP-N-acetylgalactosamine diphosphorylase / glucosamine-1-phosphate N-acetyltransferase / galactosamine-1-phosphate N-acetyltransferase
MSLTGELFDLAGFEHRSLFQEHPEQPWLAIDGLQIYLTKHAEHRVEADIHPRALLEGPVFVGAGTVIKAGAVILGPAIIGAHCLIGDALVRHCLIGDRCIVGHASELTNSILLSESAAPHFNYVGDSILGNRVHLAGGVLCANVRLDKTPVSVKFGRDRFHTTMSKLGALIGDDSQLGAACVLNPGVVVGKGVIAFPGAHLHGWYPPRSRVTVRLVQECRSY